MEIQETPSNEADKNSQIVAMLTWIATIFFSFIAPLVVYLVKKDDHFISTHARGALNLSLTILIIYLLSLPVGWIFLAAAAIPVMLLLSPLLTVWQIVGCIVGAVKCSNGKEFRVPFVFRFLK